MHECRHKGISLTTAHADIAPAERLLDFSSSTNFFAGSITATLVEQIPYPFLHSPHGDYDTVLRSLSEFTDIPEQNILLGNGISELIWYMLSILQPRKVIFIGPVFTECITACITLNIAYEIVATSPETGFTLEESTYERIWQTDADLVWLCTPNNPAGCTYENIASLLQMIRAPRVCIDSSYREFLAPTAAYAANSHQAYLAQLQPGVALYTLHSTTSFFCAPGIRLGYLVTEPAQIRPLKRRRPAWVVNPYSLLMGEAFLQHVQEYRATLPQLARAVASLAADIRTLPLFMPDLVFEGVSFVTARLSKHKTTADVTEKLLRQGIRVHNCDTTPGMPASFLRIQAHPQEDQERLIKALRYLN